jgi:hydroxymethylpyrimidine kinase/phosphomethylpyrimidine kinase/thiamine-phosphate diphosphorylase
LTTCIAAPALHAGGMPISSVEDMQAAAKKLQGMGPRYVLVKGGHLIEQQQQQQQGQQGQHLQGAPALADAVAVDVLCDGQSCWTLTSPAVASSNLHGTGCTLASAIAAAIARGQPVPEAAQTAKAYLTSVLKGSVEMKLGAGPQRPFNHGVGLDREGLFSVRCTMQAVKQQQGAYNWQQEEEKVQQQQQQGLRQLNKCDLRVYVVTDAGCNKKTGRRLVEAVRGAVAGGATVVQIREKDIDGGDFVKEALEVIQVTFPRPLQTPSDTFIEAPSSSAESTICNHQFPVPFYGKQTKR